MSDEGCGDPPCGTTGRDLPPELIAEPTDWRHQMRAEIRRLQLEVARLTAERDEARGRKPAAMVHDDARSDEWPPVVHLFERNEDAERWHDEYGGSIRSIDGVAWHPVGIDPEVTP